MKKFIVHSVIWAVLLMSSIFAVYLCADGKTDAFYVRFTTPQQTSLILGSSKAAQGIQPQVLKKAGIAQPIFNFAFTAPISPYGPAYVSAIKKKLDPNTKNGIFIITVAPRAICISVENPDEVASLKEKDFVLGELEYMNTNPNFSYLINYYNDYNLKILKNKSPMFLHEDGWLEVTAPYDEKEVHKRVNNGNYEKRLAALKFSKTRFDYLKQSINYLKSHGNVYLVRLPVHETYVNIENSFMPTFETKMQQLANDFDVPYLSMASMSSNFNYNDGIHLRKDSGVEVTKIIANFILATKPEK